MADNAEQLLVSAMVRTENIFGPEDMGITQGHFHTYPGEYEWLLRYHMDYRRAPNKAEFRSAFPDFPLLQVEGIEYAVEQVKISHLAYMLTRTMKQSANLLRSGDPREALGYLYKHSTELATNTEASNRTQNFLANPDDHFDHLLELVNTPDDQKCQLPFGYPTLDERTNGLQVGLALFASRLGQGKTWNLVHTGVEALMRGKKVTMFSLEMPARQIEARFMALLAHRLGKSFTHHAISTGRGLDLISYKHFLQEVKEMVPGELHIYDTSRGQCSSMTIAASLADQGSDLVLVDYITLLSTATGGRALEGWNVAGLISGELNEVARRFNTPIFAAAQINREGDRPSPWKPPRVKELSQSDNLGQDAYLVITMKRSSKGTAVYSLEKNRHGEDGFKWHSLFNANTGDFSEITYDRAHELANRFGEMDEDM